MTLQESVHSSEQLAAETTAPGTLVLGPDGPTPVRCATRWMDDHRAYVIAPLATATAIHQRWEATALLADQERAVPRERRLLVELLSADTLLGSDSGKEGLLLRYSEKSVTPGPARLAKGPRTRQSPKR